MREVVITGIGLVSCTGEGIEPHMAALKSGFLRGDWSDRSYRRTLLIGYGIGVIVY